MTNSWRAEMPRDFVAVDDGSDEILRCVEEETHRSVVERANAELDAAHASNQRLRKMVARALRRAAGEGNNEIRVYQCRLRLEKLHKKPTHRSVWEALRLLRHWADAIEEGRIL